MNLKTIIISSIMEKLAQELAGKVALVTGGTKGIGKAIADRLLEAGAQVIVTARRHPEEKLKHHFIAADLTIASDTVKIVPEISKQFGAVDILVNNMGGSTSPSGGFGALSDQD